MQRSQQPGKILSIQHACNFYLHIARTVFQLLKMLVLQEHFEECLVQEEVLVADIFAVSDQVRSVYDTSLAGTGVILPSPVGAPWQPKIGFEWRL